MSMRNNTTTPARSRTAALSMIAAGAAVFALAACSSGKQHDAAPASSTLASVAATSMAEASPAAPVPDKPAPDPQALTDVLNRLADPNLPGAEKVDAVQGATAEQLDKFTKAVVDAGFAPLSFTVNNPKWSTSTPGDVDAMVTVNSPNPKMGGLTVPMTFAPKGEGWQLSKQTADILLKAGQSIAGSGVRQTETTPAPPTP